MIVQKIPIKAFEKRDNGLIKVDLDNLPLPPDFVYRHQILIYLPPMQFGGNHKHPRREIFLTLSDDVEIHWIDAYGAMQVQRMNNEGGPCIYVMPPLVPHAVVNKSTDKPAIVFELADGQQYDVERHIVYAAKCEL